MDEERRQFDISAHLEMVRRIGEVQGQINVIEVRGTSANDQLRAHHSDIETIKETLYGGKMVEIGLVETIRTLKRNIYITISVCAFIFSALGRSIAPLWDKMVTDWVYSDPMEKLKEQEPKHVRHIIYHHVQADPASD